MKKVLSIVLALAMICSMNVLVFAGDENPTNKSTQVTYTGTGTEAYEITVPSEMTPGTSAEVKVEGTWASNRQLVVESVTGVTLTNNLDKTTKELTVIFPGIILVGSNTNEISKAENITVGEMTALFGDWTGTITYSVAMGNVSAE